MPFSFSKKELALTDFPRDRGPDFHSSLRIICKKVPVEGHPGQMTVKTTIIKAEPVYSLAELASKETSMTNAQTTAGSIKKPETRFRIVGTHHACAYLWETVERTNKPSFGECWRVRPINEKGEDLSEEARDRLRMKDFVAPDDLPIELAQCPSCDEPYDAYRRKAADDGTCSNCLKL